MKIFKHVMLDHETNFRIVVGVWKNPQDVHKEIHILFVTSVETIRSLRWAAKISSIRKIKEISNFSLEMMICIEKM